MRLFAIAMIACAAVAATANSWDNNITPNGSNGRAISPPTFPNIRVADDFNLGGKSILGAAFGIIEDAAWVSSGFLTVDIWSDTGGSGPGALMNTSNTAVTRTASGISYFGRAHYTYTVSPGNATPGGVGWIVPRDPRGTGTGTNYWMTSDGGSSGGGSTGYVSSNAGTSWTNEGTTWHHAFVLRGVPEPATMLALGAGLAALAARRRRK